jgi:hypothetical protein
MQTRYKFQPPSIDREPTNRELELIGVLIVAFERIATLEAALRKHGLMDDALSGLTAAKADLIARLERSHGGKDQEEHPVTRRLIELLRSGSGPGATQN